ncbi:hypothetical protein EW145_g6808 [Phellinidium pouzarii]|uniref:Uncharacterized protein n=1 Tax=Phellinidium pouzarii TaxID=167371 RepID=A0A4S4KUR7_9AGAM|nr:hypothetical protein EW145_g6808 [Phellinidium pouzarii]
MSSQSLLYFARSSGSKATRQLELCYSIQRGLHTSPFVLPRALQHRKPALSTPPQTSISQRFKSGHVSAVKQPGEPLLFGDEPPLFDGKPQWWARWAFVLLAFDMIFTVSPTYNLRRNLFFWNASLVVGFSVDMVMRNWTKAVEKPSASLEEASSSQNQRKEYDYVLRPLSQRLGLSAFELVVGIVAGSLILASRDRIVWRPPPRPSPGAQTINVLSLETASGHSKRFLLRDCTLAPGRDLSELFLRAGSVRGHFVLTFGNARVLGLTKSTFDSSRSLRELLNDRTEADVAMINSTQGSTDPNNAGVAELRKMLARAWILSGAMLSVPVRPSAWTNGPVVQR